MNILGISCYFHDAAAALLMDGMLLAAAEEERFTRRNHDYEFSQLAMDFCLRAGGSTARIWITSCFSKNRSLSSNGSLYRACKRFPARTGYLISWFGDKLRIRHLIEKRSGMWLVRRYCSATTICPTPMS